VDKPSATGMHHVCAVNIRSDRLTDVCKWIQIGGRGDDGESTADKGQTLD